VGRFAGLAIRGECIARCRASASCLTGALFNRSKARHADLSARDPERVSSSPIAHARRPTQRTRRHSNAKTRLYVAVCSDPVRYRAWDPWRNWHLHRKNEIGFQVLIRFRGCDWLSLPVFAAFGMQSLRQKPHCTLGVRHPLAAVIAIHRPSRYFDSVSSNG